VSQSLAHIEIGSAHRLTERQKDCLRLVGQGYTSKEIGRVLDLSPSTVDNHILAAVQVLGALNRGEAARILVSSEARQNLPRELRTLANSPEMRPLSGTAKASTASMSDRKLWSLPPLGGRVNELDAAEKTIRIVQVAVVSFGTVISLSLLVAGAFRIFS
jgi:DNA-binding CsgD family transcriptional regulator